MPELVEVETTRRDLSKIITLKKIKDVKIYLDKIVINDNNYFINVLKNNKILSVNRRGKWLYFELLNCYLIIHFKMEGRFYLKDVFEKRDKHDYVELFFDDFKLSYNDPRLFGKMLIIEKDKLENFFIDKKLGLEYDDKRLDYKYLKQKYMKKNIPIKKTLLDQSIMTGIGNIYADEILFKSNINPYKKTNLITVSEIKKIIENTKIVFEDALLYKGTYPNIDGKRGTYESKLKVHMRKGMKCYICNSIIKKEEIGKRGTYFCPKCQKLR